MEQIRKLKTTEEKLKLAEELPGRKFAKIIKNIGEGKIEATALPSQLQKQLEISLNTAKKMAKELEEKILAHI